MCWRAQCLLRPVRRAASTSARQRRPTTATRISERRRAGNNRPGQIDRRPRKPYTGCALRRAHKYHPKTHDPMAALATHYETNADNTQFTFYLRGHASPRGIKLPNTDTLRQEYEAGKLEEDFSRGHVAPPDNIPARWSDGTTITAHDFVYSWQRVVNPETTADYASLLYYVKNAEEINSGKVRFRDPATGPFPHRPCDRQRDHLDRKTD